MRLIPEQETLTIEFKSDVTRYPDSDIFEAVVAFANTDGGDLYLGVEDDGTITGVNEAHKNPITLSAFIAIKRCALFIFYYFHYFLIKILTG